MIETGALNDFYKGIKKHQPEWVKPLRAIASKIVRELNRIPIGLLADTSGNSEVLAPAGFRHTERIATWLDSIAKLSSDDVEEDKFIIGGASVTRKPPPISDKEIKDSGRITYGNEYASEDGSPGTPAWGQLNPTQGELTKSLPGSLGRKRRASQVGRNPRRIHRMLTDPERRIFDTKARTSGGIVLIDASGSMHFRETDIVRIMELAPGALVAMYAENEDGSSGEPNLHVIAKNGKTVEEIHRSMTGNNVDLPALQWAAAQRKSSSTPVAWVTDGEVTGVDGNVYASLGVQCIEFCKRERVILAENIDEAVCIMGDLKTGRKPRWTWPTALQRMHKEHTGRSLSQ